MIVGREITLSGDISFCDRLVVEGSVEASLHECHELEIVDGGVFKGNATTASAEVRGRFIGDLVVRKRLVIGASGQVFGTVTYREIEIVGGARVSGILMHEPKAVLSW
jgi:cytoskeletal protein CcmA (bactofilin family)